MITNINRIAEPKLIGITQLSKRWTCSRHHIWNKIDQGQIPAIKSGKKWFIPMSYVLEYEKIHDKLAKEKIDELIEFQKNQLGNS